MTKTLEEQRRDWRISKARALRTIADVEALKRQWAREEFSRTTYGQHLAEVRRGEREFSPKVRKWSSDIADIKQRNFAGDKSYTPEDYVRDQLLGDSEQLIPRYPQGWRR